MTRLLFRPFLVCVLIQTVALGAPLILSDRRVHLGTAGLPEWEWFAGHTPDARRLDLHFKAQPNAGEATLFIRQDDVRQDWFVELNGRRLGKLFLMEADLVHAVAVPRMALHEGENLLSIVPPAEIDDILIHRVWIDARPMSDAMAEATLSVDVNDTDTREPLPCRLTIVEAQRSLAPVLALTNAAVQLLAVRPGVIYTGNGQARIGLPAGDYTVYASRGFEWGVATQRLHLAVGQAARLPLLLRREVPTPGWVSCDTHVHTFTHSRHGDATLDERLLTLAGEGIELPVATDHNLHIDYTEAARRLGVASSFTPVTGNEVTTPAGHFNLFPVQPDARVADFTITDWPRLMTAMRATPGARVVVLNHPRNVHSNFQPFAATNFNAVTGENKRGAEFTFDAMELLNSSAQQSDSLLVLRDWFALLNHGYRVTAVGSSDSHDVSRYIVGQGRTYIACPDADPAHLDIPTACSNLISGRALVSLGLLAQMTVNDQFGIGDLATGLGKEVRVQVRVLGPSWVTASNIALFANGVIIREESLAVPDSADRGVKAVVTWILPRPAHDVHLVAMASGPEVTAPYWAIPRPYQPTSTRWTGRVITVTNPIWLDADGDGRFTPARAYAEAILKNYHGVAPVELLLALKSFDEAVAAQAASLCAGAGMDLKSAEFSTALRSAPAPVQRGFAAYVATLR